MNESTSESRGYLSGVSGNLGPVVLERVIQNAYHSAWRFDKVLCDAADGKQHAMAHENSPSASVISMPRGMIDAVVDLKL